MGLNPYPGFAHNQHPPDPDCGLYYGGGYTTSTSSYRPSPPKTQDAPHEISLCLEDGNTWQLYLRLPEIAELGDIRLLELRTGLVEVDAGGTKESLSLMELRPGIGTAQLAVPPVFVDYRVSAGGAWPPSLSKKQWQGIALGIGTEGTLFRLRRGEWVRVKEGSAIEFGEKLRVVADWSKAPPAECSREPMGVVTNKGIKWRMWRIVLPHENSVRVESWADELGVVLVEPAWEASLLSVPQGFIGDVPIVGTKQTLVAKLKSPEVDSETSVFLRTTDGGSRSSDITANGEMGFISFSVFRPGENELIIGNDESEILRFDTEYAPSLRQIRESLLAVPVLRLKIGEEVIEPGDEVHNLSAPTHGEEPAEIMIEPEFEELRLALSWGGLNGRRAEDGLTAEAVKNRLRAFWSENVEARVSAGVLGSIVLRFHAPLRVDAQSVNLRVLRWANIGAKDQIGGSSWLRRRLAEIDRSSLKAARPGNDRWTPLVVSKLKRSNSATRM